MQKERRTKIIGITLVILMCLSTLLLLRTNAETTIDIGTIDYLEEYTYSIEGNVAISFSHSDNNDENDILVASSYVNETKKTVFFFTSQEIEYDHTFVNDTKYYYYALNETYYRLGVDYSSIDVPEEPTSQNVSNLIQMLEEKNQTIAELENIVTELGNQKTSLQDTISDLENTISQQNSTINNQSENISIMNETINNQSENISIMNGTINNQSLLIENLQDQINSLGDQKGNLQDTIDDLNGQIAVLESRDENLSSTLEKRNETIRDKNSDIHALEDQISRAVAEVHRLEDPWTPMINITSIIIGIILCIIIIKFAEKMGFDKYQNQIKSSLGRKPTAIGNYLIQKSPYSSDNRKTQSEKKLDDFQDKFLDKSPSEPKPSEPAEEPTGTWSGENRGKVIVPGQKKKSINDIHDKVDNMTNKEENNMSEIERVRKAREERRKELQQREENKNDKEE